MALPDYITAELGAGRREMIDATNEFIRKGELLVAHMRARADFLRKPVEQCGFLSEEVALYFAFERMQAAGAKR